jgi:hypothetical protein
MGTGELYAAQQAEERRRQAVRDSQRYKDTIWHDKDENLAGVQEVISVNNITISRADIKREEARLNAFGAQYGKAFSKSGTWSMRVSNQQQAIRAREAQQIALRGIGLKAAKLNPVNIERWANEIKVEEEEEERLLQIQLEIQRVENQRLQEIENQKNQRLQEIENQRLQKIENQRLQEIENQRLQIRYTWEIENNQRLQEIERQKAIIAPEIIPSVVASSSLIPLGIIAFLLINSRKGKK